MPHGASAVRFVTDTLQLLAPASDALTNPCLTGPITDYDWAEGIALMTVFTMFFIELMAARFDVFGHQEHDLEASDPSKDLFRASEKGNAKTSLNEGKEPSFFWPLLSGGEFPLLLPEPVVKLRLAFIGLWQPVSIIALLIRNPARTHSHSHRQISDNEGAINPTPNASSDDDTIEGPSKTVTRSSIPGREDDFSYPPGGEDHLGHRREHDLDEDHFAAQMTAIFILEFGVIFHSIFIGLTLAVAGDNFNVLYIVLVFHQTFEGLGLGSRLATAEWPRSKRWMPWVLGGAYGITTPIAIAIGLAVSSTFAPNSQKTLIVNGVFDSISAGILIYTGLVELMAHEFMFNPEMRKSSIKMMLFAYLCMCVGAGLMALLGKWA